MWRNPLAFALTVAGNYVWASVELNVFWDLAGTISGFLLLLVPSAIVGTIAFLVSNSDCHPSERIPIAIGGAVVGVAVGFIAGCMVGIVIPGLKLPGLD